MKSTYDSPTIEPIGGTGADLNAGIAVATILFMIAPVFIIVRPDKPPVVIAHVI